MNHMDHDHTGMDSTNTVDSLNGGDMDYSSYMDNFTSTLSSATFSPMNASSSYVNGNDESTMPQFCMRMKNGDGMTMYMEGKWNTEMACAMLI
jgi:hypothetical protein